MGLRLVRLTPVQNRLVGLRLVRLTPVQNRLVGLRLVRLTPVQNRLAGLRLVRLTPVQNRLAGRGSLALPARGWLARGVGVARPTSWLPPPGPATDPPPPD